METIRTSTTYFIPPGKFLLMENALGNPDLIQSSVSSDCRVTIVDTANFPLDELEQWPTFRLTSSDVKLKLGEGLYYVYIVVPTPDNAETTTAFISYNTVKVDRKGYDADGKLLGKEKFCYYQCGTVSARGGNPSVVTTPSGQGRVIEMDLGVTPAPSTLPGDLNDFDKMFQLDKVDPNNPKSWLLTILATVKSMTARLVRITGSLVFGSGESEKVVTDVALSGQSVDANSVSDSILPTTAWVDARFLVLDDRFLRKDQDDHTPHSLSVGKSFSVGKKITTHDGLSTDDFLEGASGASVYQNKDGQWCIETDNVKARRKFSANDVDIQSTDHIGGQAILTAARMRIDYVLDESEYYRCYFRKSDGEGNVIRNEWKPSDLAYCNTFNLERQSDGSIGNHYYWREVVAVSSEANQDTESERTFGDETIRTADYHFVDLSKLEYAEGSNAPKSGDKVVQLGYSGNDDSGRQSAIVIAGAGTGSPYIQIFEGIHDFSLPSNPDQLKPGDNRLSGRLAIKAGSTGWENLAGLPEKIEEAMNSAVDLEGLEYGKNNLLLNSGFTGDFVTASLSGDSMLKGGSKMFSPSLKYWNVNDYVVVEESEVSESGYEVFMADDGYLEQTLLMRVVPNDNYIFSFRGKGGAIRLTFGEVYHQFDLDDENWGTYSHKFQAPDGVTSLRVEAVADCSICELQLERGTVRSAWGMSPLDNRSELAKYESMSHIRNLLKSGGLLEAGVVNTGLITMGKVNEEGELTGNTAGISGQYNDDDSVAYWAGGDYEQALYAIATYLDNPNYTPTKEELSNMAKFVVTHGGRAILNDVILRGYIYALGGKFKGVVEATDGKFRGEVEATSGTFNNVSFQSGFIGGFRVSGSGIINQIGENAFDNDAYFRLKNTSEGTEAAIGGNVIPPSTGRKLLARFVNEKDKLSQYSSLPNECFEIGAKGAVENVALSIDGGCIEGLAYRTYTVSGNGTSNIPKNVTEVLCTNTQIINVYLPSLDVYDDGHVVRVTRTGSEFWLYPFDCNTLNSYEPVYGRTLIYHEGNYYSYSNPISIQSWHTCELVWHRDFSKTINGVEYRGVWILTA